MLRDYALIHAPISSLLFLLRQNCLTAESPCGQDIWGETTCTDLLVSPSFITPAKTLSLLKVTLLSFGDQAVAGAVVVQPPSGR